jgi:hypothetical protein
VSAATWALIGAGTAAAIGSMLPWAVIRTPLSQQPRYGTDGDGLLTLIAGLLIVGIGIAAVRRGTQVKHAAVAAAVSAGVALVAAWNAFGDDTAELVASGMVDVGIGAFITTAAGVVGVSAALSQLGECQRASEPC